jgi:hypothetical protein
MNKLRAILFIAVMAAVCSRNADAQLVVAAPAVETVLEVTHLDQMIYYIQSIEQMVQNVMHAYNQVQAMIRAEQRAIQNLRSITEVKSFDGFMSWYNRQLSLERQVENRFNSIGVNIGGKQYKISEIDDIPNAMKDTYVDYWDKEFTPQQRREMWLNLGMTPSNYAYVQTWKEREKVLGKNILTKLQTVNEENMDSFERQNEIAQMLKNDVRTPDEQKLSEKALLQMQIEISMDTNRAIREMRFDQAEAAQRELVKDKLGATPPPRPALSEHWNEDMFGSITDEEGESINLY